MLWERWNKSPKRERNNANYLNCAGLFDAFNFVMYAKLVGLKLMWPSESIRYVCNPALQRPKYEHPLSPGCQGCGEP